MLVPAPIVAPIDALRPQFHFTAPSGWLNDPNGLVFENGQYHLFYQHNPFGTEWGNMTWGHAVSTDLLHWKDLPNAIEPDALGTIFSGSAVIDKHNTSGFGTHGHPPLVCLYTAAGGTNDVSKGKPFTQCLAWSLDGHTFTKFSGNPVVPHIAEENRDPKVFWHAPSKQWVMALYLQSNHYALLGSPNLTTWTKLSDVMMPQTDECPDFFELPVDGDSKNKKWVFWGANGHYRVGSFDGKEFLAQTPVFSSYFGNTAYASQTYSNEPKGRRIQIAWLNGSQFPGCSWNQQMGFPNVLTLHTTPAGPKLQFWPIDEIRSIREHKIEPKVGAFEVPSGLIDAEGEWSIPSSGSLSLTVNGVDIKFDKATEKLTALDKSADIDTTSGKLSLRVLADRATIEIYAQHGQVLMPLFVLPKDGVKHGVVVHSEGDWKGKISVYELKPSLRS